MTIGFWYERARSSLRAAQDAMTSGHARTAEDVRSVINARSAIFSQLDRLAQRLTTESPRPRKAKRARASTTFDSQRQRQDVIRLRVGLREVVPEGSGYSPTPPNATDLALALNHAADAVAIIGDIIGSHAPSGQHPRTPEGAALRAGGGASAAFGDVAQLLVDVIAVDSGLAAWVIGGGVPLADEYRPVLNAANWTINSPLVTAALDLIDAAAGQPNLLRELGLARAPLHPAPAVTSAEDAITAIRVARTWLWQNPDQIALAHIQMSVQLGLAVQILTSGGVDTAELRVWRRGAIAASELRGTPAVDQSRSAAAELIETLRWLRQQLPPDQRQRADENVGSTAGLRKELPLLSAGMYRGLRSLLQRRDIFTSTKVLRHQVGSPVLRAVDRWRPATYYDEPVRDLSHALSQAQRAESATVAATPVGTAVQSFTSSPHPDGSPAGGTLPLVSRPGSAVTPRRGR